MRLQEVLDLNSEAVGKMFVKRHWKMLAVAIIGIILAMAGAVMVYLWFVEDAQSTGMVPSTLSQVSVGHIVDFILHLAFWEVLLVGIPVAVSAIAFYFLWWRRLPSGERREYRRAKIFGSDSHSTKAGNGISFAIHVFILLKIYMDGNWNVAISTWSLDYLVNTGLWALLCILVIAGIPMVIGGLWWLSGGKDKIKGMDKDKYSTDGC